MEDFKKQLKEKDRQIRTLKSERDSIYGELKATTSSHSFSRVLPQKKNQPAHMPREIFRQEEITK